MSECVHENKVLRFQHENGRRLEKCTDCGCVIEVPFQREISEEGLAIDIGCLDSPVEFLVKVIFGLGEEGQLELFRMLNAAAGEQGVDDTGDGSV